ncbi:MAG: SH3 domain-containing protein [Anaerolineae bacterium]|nr:SH3 domain-containing protein [Anaerolineae bacterium]
MLQRNWFKNLVVLLAILCLGGVAFSTPKQAGAYQDAPTPAGIVITVTYTDPMNVRGGPGTFYDIIGQLFPGDVRPALGISPGREWIQISYEGGIGWVYAPYVSVSGGELQVVEPPPTPTPLTTATIDPTLAAAFNLQPTETRMPTFTAPPPLAIPQFTPASAPQARGVPFGYFVIILGVLGALGLVFTFISRR